MVTQMGTMAAYAIETEIDDTSLCVAEGERLGLYEIIERVGPVTPFGLSYEAMAPLSLVMRWLASQTRAGYVVRDVVTGRYRTWCILPDAGTEMQP